MKQYILGFTTAVIFAILGYYIYGYSIHNKLNQIQNEIVNESIEHTNTFNQDVVNVNIYPSFFSGGVKDISDDIQPDYNPYPYSTRSGAQLDETYSVNNGEYLLGILHQNILISDIKGNQIGWTPWFAIHDAGKECHRGNRPTGFLQSGDKLLMTIVDRCGGGSMEGYVSSYELQQDGKRELAGCYNYANRDPFQELAPEVYKDKRYEWGTTQLDKLPVEPLSTCEGNIQIQYYM